ncbi:MAG: hypothetical protein JWO80_1199 [Bryobacterales bacterium]|nr:hypothetical protein [Bryobacterales bacterium]
MRRYLDSLILGAALLGPAVLSAQPPQRYYDRDHRDWHEWNEREARAHRHWLLEERHRREYREYSRTPRRDQREYWRWRHEHQDWH